MQTLYPSIKTYATHQLKVDELHTLYIEESGNPNGQPIIVLHSGPGAGSEQSLRRFFDPEVYRIILFDQRGCGRSTPHAAIQNNTTEHLINDIEKIREHLKIEQWYIFGGAWGATLGLLYAQRYAKHVLGMVLHSIFLGRIEDIQWFYQQGANKIFPDYWQEFIEQIPLAERGDIISAYYKRLTGNDELTRMASAKAWSLWQARCTALQPHSNIIDHFSDPRFAINLACIETYYFKHGCFIEPNEILSHMDGLKDIKAYIIHGRYDMVCPLDSAFELHSNWPGSELCIIRDAGHSAREPGIIDAIVYATKKLTRSNNRLA